MTTDRYALSLAALMRRVEGLANGDPSLEALYALESGFEYSDFWYPAYKLLLQHCEAQGSQDAWRTELSRPPPDLVMWLSFHRRRNATTAAIQEAAHRWRSLGPERMLASHHATGGELEGVAAVHITLLAELHPVGAVEYIAGLPSEHLVWPAVYRIRLHERQELIDRVLVESHMQEAVVLCLACILDKQCSDLRGLVNRSQRNNHDGIAEPAARGAFDEASTGISHRHRQVAAALMQRDDAGAVLGPWVRHLVRSGDQASDFDGKPRSRVATVALEQVLAALPERATLELARTSAPSATCVVARMLISTRTGQGSTDWEEWQSLLKAEHESLRFCASISWQAAAEVLLRARNPRDTWIQTARALQPTFRRRERGNRGDVNPVAHLVMPGMIASAALGSEGAPLWESVLELALRQFLVERPSTTDLEYRLCSNVFAAFPHIFNDIRSLERTLTLLPTQAHIDWAREHLCHSPQTERP